MRYYNENPQVALWREKFEKLKVENEELKDENVRLTLEAVQYREQLEDLILKQKKEEEDTRERAVRYVAAFNAIPWYKKMFYKFKIQEKL